MTNVTCAQTTAWFTKHVPDGWFDEIETKLDKDEIVVIGTLPVPAVPDGEDAELARLEAASAFREATREDRIGVALRAETLFERKVSWAVAVDDSVRPFSTLSLPVMTRLGFAEREVLDTLVAAGVARSRSDALGWCVRLVGSNQAEWIDKLRTALEDVETLRSEGPG